MKFIFTSLILLITSLTLNAQVSAEYICTQFLSPDAEGVFRGLDFGMDNADIEMIESDRNNMNLVDQNDEFTLMNYRLNLSVSNYAKVAYEISGDALSGVTGRLYVSNEGTAFGVVDYMTNFYASDLGSPQANEDGSLTFTGVRSGQEVSLNLAVMKDGTKNYVYYVLSKNS